MCSSMHRDTGGQPVRSGKQPHSRAIHPLTMAIAHFLQAAWFLKLRALTAQTYVDEVEMDEEGIAEAYLDDTAIADVASELEFYPCKFIYIYI